MASLLRLGYRALSAAHCMGPSVSLMPSAVETIVVCRCSSFSSAAGKALLEGRPLLRNNQALFTALRHLASKSSGRAGTARSYESASDSDSDSDSDSEGERGTSTFWRRKMYTIHALMDINNDGVVSWDDFRIIADKFVNLGHLTPKQQENFRSTLKTVWEEQWGAEDPYNLITMEQYVTNMTHVINDKSLKKKAHLFLPYLFKAVDKDRSGSISVAEFKLFFECLGLDEEEAIKSFNAIDTNGDGILSLKEFVKTGREFFLTEDERKPSKHFWGPLFH
ncbi:sarcoplasmic calcium-binding protein [Ischnura elegans]|uniref:sarcoplasmic calcium-binding protein n=1 Tax=Ischnura elegans TaxID=197161 RepID=UPI001ED88553|nr:sarcoplasmic calcium-binding protein [Ischnura elegans]